jgi:hypothetical protein
MPRSGQQVAHRQPGVTGADYERFHGIHDNLAFGLGTPGRTASRDDRPGAAVSVFSRF